MKSNAYLFHGCLTREKFKEEKAITDELIHSIDPEIWTSDDFPCCGSFLFQHGSNEEIKAHVEKVMEWFKERGIDHVITECAGCDHYFKDEYPKYIPGFDDSIKVEHVIQYIYRLMRDGKLPFELVHDGLDKIKFTYHDACHL
ncbi:MAG: heterodisulfide reductase-related iron-sulfur binding cluster, partial [Promethearchaeota archaeon]